MTAHECRRRHVVLGGLALAGLVLARHPPLAAQGPVARLPISGFTVVRSFPHDRDAFTQGLEYAGGFLYEGTGLNGRSSIRKVKLDTGEVVLKRDVAAEHFGEGITLFGGRLFELTWRSGMALVYNAATFAPVASFTYPGEGWGLTHDPQHLIMSDGSEFLRVLEPSTFAEIRRVRVMGLGQPLKNINELEYVKGEVLANVWLTDYIARIDPVSGQIKGYIDLRGLLAGAERSADAVLNGIAYDAAGDRLFVTGKLWPRIFEITLTPPR